MAPPPWRISSRTGAVTAVLRGVAREIGPDGTVIVEIETGALVVATLSSRMRAKGDVEPGDDVRVEVRATDMKHGTITSITRTT